MEDITMGLEIELHAQPTSNLLKVNSTLRPDSLRALNDATLAGNENVNITLEFPGSRYDVAKIELTTPVAKTGSREGIVTSTEDMFHLIQYLYYFIHVQPKGNPKQKTIHIYNPERKRPETKRYGCTLQSFFEYYRDVLKIYGHLAAKHPPIQWYFVTQDKFRKYFRTQDRTQPLVGFSFPAIKGRLIPELAPQITFSIPLERVPLFLRSTKEKFSLTGKDREKAFTPQMVEILAALIAEEFFGDAHLQQYKAKTKKNLLGSSSIVVVARKNQRLRGFITLIVYHLVQQILSGHIDRMKARSKCPKDDFRFLLKSSLHKLYWHGLSNSDRAGLTIGKSKIDSIKTHLAPYVQANIQHVVDQLTEDIEINDITRGNLKEDVSDWLKAIFAKETEQSDRTYERCLLAMMGSYALYSSVEQEVARKQNRKMDRALFEYRRFSGPDRKQHYADCNMLLKEIEQLYNILQVLERKGINPTKKSIKGSKAYYQPLKKISLSHGVQKKYGITLKLPKVDQFVQRWWRTGQV